MDNTDTLPTIDSPETESMTPSIAIETPLPPSGDAEGLSPTPPLPEIPSTADEYISPAPAAGTDSPPASQELPPAILQQLTAIGSTLENLQQRFDDKLRYDESKQLIIDRQHNELEQFRREEFTKLNRAIIQDVIGEIDSVEKHGKFYEALEATPENFAKLLKLFHEFSEDLRDLLERNDVTAYRSESGDIFDAKRQRVLKTVPTDNASLNRTIEENMRWGFELNGKVIRPELVSVYVLRTPQETGEAPSH